MAKKDYPNPQITYPFRDLYREIIIRNPKKVGSLGSRCGLRAKDN